jgi:hypothetical protein
MGIDNQRLDASGNRIKDDACALPIGNPPHLYDKILLLDVGY